MEEIVTAYHLQEEQFRFDRYTFADRISAPTDEDFYIDFAKIRKTPDEAMSAHQKEMQTGACPRPFVAI